MTAVASMGGVIASTEPGGVPVSAPFSDAFTRADGPAGQPWYTPDCGESPLLISSDKLVASSNTVVYTLGLLLDADDFDLTFDVHYGASTGADDVQVAFRISACWTDADHYLFATNPNVGGSHGGTLYQVTAGPTFTVVHFEDHSDILEANTYTFRLHVHGTTFDWYVNGSLYYSTTMPSGGSGRAVQFVMDKLGTWIDNVSLA